MPRQLVWFRNDLRTRDNPALAAAMHAGETIALFVISAPQWRGHGMGNNRIAFLLRSLEALSVDLAALRVPLRIVMAASFDDVPAQLARVVAALGVGVVHCNAEYAIDERRRDARAATVIEREGAQLRLHHGGVLSPPGAVLTGNGTPFTVFTPFKRKLRERLPPGDAVPLPRLSPQPACDVASDAVPNAIDGVDSQALASLWPGGSAEAERRLTRFVDRHLASYAGDRDRPDRDGTSTLSPYLAVGAISVRTCFARARAQSNAGAQAWEDELIWRDFYQHVIASFDHVSRGDAFRQHYDAMVWIDDAKGLAAWQAGRTGYPLVDAGMRQLSATGWMHNRLRMVTAMFLTKHLLIDWREGERHFMDLLVDGDFASNNGGWQWSASTGTDAAPYFRIFNPVAQAKKCDPDGAFVRKWIPELAAAKTAVVLEPWRSPASVPDYPPRIVEHGFARKRAIAAFKAIGS